VWRSGGIAPHILTSEVDEGEWSASRAGRFTLGLKAYGIYWIGSSVGPKACLYAVAKRKISITAPAGNRSPQENYGTEKRFQNSQSLFERVYRNHFMFMDMI
jgi:hypothetical protein